MKLVHRFLDQVCERAGTVLMLIVFSALEVGRLLSHRDEREVGIRSVPTRRADYDALPAMAMPNA